MSEKSTGDSRRFLTNPEREALARFMGLNPPESPESPAGSWLLGKDAGELSYTMSGPSSMTEPLSGSPADSAMPPWQPGQEFRITDEMYPAFLIETCDRFIWVMEQEKGKVLQSMQENQTPMNLDIKDILMGFENGSHEAQKLAAIYETYLREQSQILLPPNGLVDQDGNPLLN